ncbi:hypothetical protein QFZ74_000035 [Streptomyces sp. V3I7]|nr:hypothetical protein [Streptomyces sp. V3I7]
MLLRVREDLVQPRGILGVLLRIRGREAVDGGEQGRVRRSGEGAGLEPGDLWQTLGFQQEGAEQRLLGVVHRLRYGDSVEAVRLGLGSGGHQAARVKSSGRRVTPR